MQRCSAHNLNSFPDRRTLSWIMKCCPLLLPLTALRFLLQSVSVFLMLFIISGLIDTEGLNLVIPSLAVLLSLELLCRLIRFSSDSKCINLRISYLSAMASRRTASVSESHENILLSQRLSDYQQQDGGPVIKGYRLFEESMARASTAITAAVVLLLTIREPRALILIPFLLIVSLLSFIFEKADRKAQFTLDESMKLLAVNNRKGDYYFTLLSSEAAKMKSIRSYDVNAFVSGKYAAFMDPMINVFRRDGNTRFLISLAETVLTLAFSFIGCLIIKVPMGNLTAIFAVFSLVSFFMTVFRKGYESAVNNSRMKELEEYLSSGERQSSPVPQCCSDKAFELNGVSYTYPDASSPAVSDVSLTLEKGKIYTVVGENGSGKSTLIKLMLGILKPDEGSVASSSEGIIPYCPQQGTVLSFSTGENISLSSSYDRKRSEELIEEMQLSDKLSPDSKLGVDFSPVGIELSGGMAQRLITARSLYFSDGVLVLDEPTASLDIFAERELYELVRSSDRIDTCILVSHRLTSSLYSDRIIVMDSGHVAEEGNHTELMALDGVYRALYEAQARHYRN